MRKRAERSSLSAFVSLLLTLSILLGVCAAPALAQGADTTDKNILIYTLQVAQRAVNDGTADRLVPVVKTEFLAAKTAAEMVCAKPDATREEIQQSYQALQEAVWKLSYISADKAALLAAIVSAESTDLTGYGSAKVQAVQNTLAAAKKLAADETLTVESQAAVDTAVKGLKAALENLGKSEETAGGDNGGVAKPEKPAESSKPAGDRPVAERFTDIQADAWYIRDVQYVVDSGLMQGTGGDFAPEIHMSRAMMMTVLYRMADVPGQAATGSAWYAVPMAWAVGEGISDGSSPESNITREQIAALLFRYARAKAGTGDLSAFRDGDSVSAWARTAMTWAVEQGVFRGRAGNLLDPQGPASRAEVAAVLARFDQMSKKN